MVNLPNELGNEPEILVSASPKTVKFLHSPNSSGIFPTISLFPPALITSRFESFPSSIGRFPLRLLSKMSRFLRLTQSPSSIGIEPVNWLEFKIKFWRFLRFPIDEGISPTRLFELRSMVIRLRQLPISCGMVPVRLAPEMTSF